MIAKLKNPLVAAVLGLFISIGLGAYLATKALAPMLEKAAAAAMPVKEVVAEDIKQRGWDFWTIEIANLANELKEERARLRKQAELLDQRAARLTTEEKELGKIRADIERMRREIQDKVVEIGADEAKNIRTLSQTYANLTPKAAVSIFREMDDSTAVKILSLMKAETVGPIFEEMSKTAGEDKAMAARAALLSEKLRLMKTSKPAGAN